MQQNADVFLAPGSFIAGFLLPVSMEGELENLFRDMAHFKTFHSEFHILVRGKNN